MENDQDKLRSLILAKFPQAEVDLNSDDGVHYTVTVVDASFRGLSLVQQHRAVLAAVRAEIDSQALHALAVHTAVPADA